MPCVPGETESRQQCVHNTRAARRCQLRALLIANYLSPFTFALSVHRCPLECGLANARCTSVRVEEVNGKELDSWGRSVDTGQNESCGDSARSADLWLICESKGDVLFHVTADFGSPSLFGSKQDFADTDRTQTVATVHTVKVTLCDTLQLATTPSQSHARLSTARLLLPNRKPRFPVTDQANPTVGFRH